jgi:hypothetical protein
MAVVIPTGVLLQLKPAGHMAVFERNESFVERLGAFAEEVLPKR